jgi:predicted 2-oxoglutarate/Fe(II)-dependent dioxygenase YbiX
MKNIVFNIINPFYEFEIKDSEIPQLLYYGVDGHYLPHVDGYAQWTNPDGTMVWRKSVDRDLSLVLYLNDDYEGGEFEIWMGGKDGFVTVPREKGDVIIFPAFLMHRVKPITKGERKCLVFWTGGRPLK